MLFPIEESKIEIPPLSCALSYIDIGGEKYSKSFEVTFQILVMTFPSKDVEFSNNEPVFQGMFEFKEIN